MSLLPDPTELLAIADRIAGHAMAIRARTHQLGHAEAETGWTGLAADAFRLDAADALAALRGAADRLDTAARALRRHAGTVGHLVDLLHMLEHQLERGAVDLVHATEREIGHGIDRGVGDVGHLAHLVGI